MEIESTSLSGLMIIKPKIFKDERGFFLESYHRSRFYEAGIECDFVQDNHSLSARGTLRGLHYQSSPGQAKLVRCTRGSIWDLAVDLRLDSPTLGKFWAIELNDENHFQFFIPVGFAHGFYVLSEKAEVQYKCSAVYNAQTEAGVAWDDPDLNLPWPDKKPLLSERDKKNPTFKDFLKLSTNT